MKIPDRWAHILLGIGGLIIICLSYPSPSQAHGRVGDITKEELLGPYKLDITISPGHPTIGTLHIGLEIRSSHTDSVVADAIVIVTARDPQNNTRLDGIQAYNPPTQLEQHEIDIPVDMVGEWVVSLLVESDLGKHSLELPVQVDNKPRISLGAIATGLIALLIILMWGYRIVYNRKTSNT